MEWSATSVEGKLASKPCVCVLAQSLLQRLRKGNSQFD